MTCFNLEHNELQLPSGEYIYTCVYYIYLYTTYIYIYIYIYMYVCMYVLCVYIYIYMYVLCTMCVFKYIYIYVLCIYIYIYLSNGKIIELNDGLSSLMMYRTMVHYQILTQLDRISPPFLRRSILT